MPFLNRLRSDDWIKPDEWVVVDPLVYKDNAGSYHTVQKGFITDLASIPKLAQLLPGMDVNGRSRRPAVLHDFNYCLQSLTRAQADNLLYESLLSEGVGAPLARIYWLAVHLFGWSHWKKRKNGLDRSYDFVPADYFNPPPPVDHVEPTP